MCRQLKLLVLACLVFGAAGGEECDVPVQDKCLFIVSTGRAGSTALMHALNLMDGIFIRGENYGLFYMIESIYNTVTTFSNHQNNAADDLKLYRKFVEQNKKPAWYNAFPNNTADCLVKLIFKMLYGQGQLGAYRVGFKEVRYGPWEDTTIRQIQGMHHRQLVKPIQNHFISYTTTQTYDDFKQRLQFLQQLCKQPKIVLNMRRDTASVLKSGFFRRRGEANVSQIEAYQEWVKQFTNEFKNISFLVYYEDMFIKQVNQTIANDLMKFVNVPWSSEVTFAGITKGK